jgi:hypothetical protein
MASLEPTADGMLLQLDVEEARFLLKLFEELSDRLASEPAQADPIDRRLQPPVSHGDQAADAEVRELFGADLRSDQHERLRTVASALAAHADEDGLVHTLDTALALAMTQALNDVRLALGASIDITTLERAEVPEDDARHATLALMDHLGWLQGQLVEFLDV